MENTGLNRHIKTLIYLAPDKAPGRQRTARALLRLQRGLTGERELAGSHYMEENDLLSAYLLYYWPVSYQQISHILAQLPAGVLPQASTNGRNGISILDIGSGPGPASAAVCDFLIKRLRLKGEALSVCHADHSEKALSLARKIFSRDFPDTHSEALACDIGGNPSSQQLASEGKFSIAIFCHSLNELWQDTADRIARRTACIERVLDDCMEEDALLILCEPAQTKSSRELIAVRDALLSRRSDLRVLAPCPDASAPSCPDGHAPCPALQLGEGTTCHAEGEWDPVEPANSLAEAAGLDRRSVKMAYFIFQRTAGQAGQGNAGPARAPDSRQEQGPQDQAQDSGPVQAAAPEGSFTARVVSDAMLNKAGRIRFVLCDGKRRFSLSAKKGDPVAGAKGFWTLTRGQLLRVSGAEARGEAGNPSFAVTESTTIRILNA